MQDTDTMLSNWGETGFNMVEIYFGVKIFKDDYSELYNCAVWDYVTNRNVEIKNHYSKELKNELNFILLKNYYASLEKISTRFEHKKDYNNPDSNCEYLVDRLYEIINKIEF